MLMRKLIAALAVAMSLTGVRAADASPSAVASAAQCVSEKAEWTFDPPLTENAVVGGEFGSIGNYQCADEYAALGNGLEDAHAKQNPVNGARIWGSYYGNCSSAFLVLYDGQGAAVGTGTLAGGTVMWGQLVLDGQHHRLIAQIVVDEQGEQCDMARGSGPAMSERIDVAAQQAQM